MRERHIGVLSYGPDSLEKSLAGKDEAREGGFYVKVA